MKTKGSNLQWRWWKKAAALAIVAAAVGAVFYSQRAYRMYDTATDFESQVRYLIENGGTIGAAPANSTFSVDYLEAIFGDNPELLNQLKAVVQRGLQDSPALNLGEVAAMIVTYRMDEQDNVTEVAAHVVGGFPLSRMVPQMNRDGFFKNQIDPQLWGMGNTMLSFLGRDMVLFAEEEVADRQKDIIENIMTGDILPLASSLNKPLHYTAVFPDPRRIVPNNLRHHVQAIVLKGVMASYEGQWEMILLTTSPRSATYAMSVLNDLKRSADITLKAKFKGMVQETDWGPMVNPWWAYEMAKTSEQITMEREENIIRMKVEYQRVMVNALLKAMERFGRDWTQMRMRMEDHMDPRLVDAAMATSKPLHYWTEEHRWGPDWPIAPTEEELEERKKEQEARKAEWLARRNANTPSEPASSTDSNAPQP
jgi:hypothetical protein